MPDELLAAPPKPTSVTRAQPGGSPSSIERVDGIGKLLSTRGNGGCSSCHSLVVPSICLPHWHVNPARTGHSQTPWWSGAPSRELHLLWFRRAWSADRRPTGGPESLPRPSPTIEPMPLPTPKENTTAVVTGASSGIGAEIARELARRGHGVT